MIGVEQIEDHANIFDFFTGQVSRTWTGEPGISKILQISIIVIILNFFCHSNNMQTSKQNLKSQPPDKKLNLTPISTFTLGTHIHAQFFLS